MVKNSDLLFNPPRALENAIYVHFTQITHITKVFPRPLKALPMAFKIQTINQSTPHSADHLQLQMLPLSNKIIKISGFIVNFFVSFVSLVSFTVF